jgi:hypothetical protein
MKIIQQRELRTAVRFFRVFDRTDYPGSGFSFECDEQGNLISPAGAALDNYHECLAGVVDGQPVVDCGIRRDEWTYTDPKIGICACGEEVILDRFTCTCHGCGRDYNSAGQLLAPREQWGEETGESVADILAADTDRWED